MDSQFTENQSFNQWWIFIPWCLGLAVPLFGLYQQMVVRQPFGDKPLSNFGLVGLLLFMGIVGGLILWIRLDTRIDSKGIHLRMRPFVKKEFKWEDIQSADVVDYGFVGGWGIRMHTKYGTVYNTRGHKGLALVLKNGKKYCIGTQKDIELQALILDLKRYGKIGGQQAP